MKKRIAALLLVTVIFLGAMSQAYAYVSISFNVFVGNLQPYGSWVTVPNYGEVWQPVGVGPGWQPYQYGHWVWTDEGWMWVSNEPWGWATYHYGRWLYDPGYGWIWVPGAVWAPAWVSWSYGPNYVGWAPLPPYGYGAVQVVPAYYSYVPFHSFLSVNVYHYYVPQAQNVTIYRNTTVVNNITVVNNQVVNRGPSVAMVQQRTGVVVHPVSLVSAQTRSGASGMHGSSLYVYRPRVVSTGSHQTPLLRTEATKGTVQIGNRSLFVRPAPGSQYHGAPGPQNRAVSRPQYHGAPGGQNHAVSRPQYHGAPGAQNHAVSRPQYHGAPGAQYHPAPRPQYHGAPGAQNHAVSRPQYHGAPGAQYHPAPRPQYHPAPAPQYHPAPRPQNRPAPAPKKTPNNRKH